MLSATRQIANLSTDSGIRNAAQNFEAQLTRAYQYGKQTSFEQKSNQTASQQVGYVSNQDMRTMLDNSPLAMQKAIETFGSAENAQNVLFHSPAARSAFANHLHQEVNNSGWNNGQAIPLSTIDIDTMARPHRESFNNESIREFDLAVSANNLDSQIAKQNSIGNLEVLEAPNTNVVSQAVKKEQQQIQKDQEKVNSNLLQDRGSTLSAQRVYRDKQTGVSTVVDNAFLGAIGYKSPQEYKDRFLAKSEDSPEHARSMLELGDKKEVKLADIEQAIQRNR